MSKPCVILGVTGSIAAIKAPKLVRLLMEKGVDVHCVMTPNAAHFVTPFVLSTLSGAPVITDMFDSTAAHLPHLKVAEEADVFLIAPASAATIARCARGVAEDMVSLTYLATKAPVLMAPAMHDTMWDHPATQENVKILKSRGVQFVGPGIGPLADNTQGEGRFSEPEEIVSAVEKILSKK